MDATELRLRVAMRAQTPTTLTRSERRGKRRNVKKTKPAPLSERRALIAKYGSYEAVLGSTEYRKAANGRSRFATWGWMGA